jgi:hypothetical protein
LIPADRLADEASDERADDPEHRGHDQTEFLIARQQRPRDQAHDEADDDHPDVLHGAPLLIAAGPPPSCQRATVGETLRAA